MEARELVLTPDLFSKFDEFYDEDGAYHFHTPSILPDPVYRCSNGHQWSVPQTCWCGHPLRREPVHGRHVWPAPTTTGSGTR
jgi:hypothetical protein